ncbi:uncharacterized protein G2W53_006072 [Senna tora]|uniref:Uncharacterized protein n=1 Tax=Senna tora TaxID=362788 RepID=A0A834X3X9_9FABA|nr:uncharacterized protein G2W53_006072 [Senna tora]
MGNRGGVEGIYRQEVTGTDTVVGGTGRTRLEEPGF